MAHLYVLIKTCIKLQSKKLFDNDNTRQEKLKFISKLVLFSILRFFEK